MVGSQAARRPEDQAVASLERQPGISGGDRGACQRDRLVRVTVGTAPRRRNETFALKSGSQLDRVLDLTRKNEQCGEGQRDRAEDASE